MFICHTIQHMDWSVLKIFRETPGWCPLNKAKFLYGVINSYKPEVVLEIGVFAGKSFLPMARTVQEYGGQAIGIEPFKLASALEGVNPDTNDKWWSEVDYEQLERDVEDRITRYKLENTVKLVKKTSKQALAEMPAKIGLIHQDSNHSEAVSLWETQHYAPLLVAGGFYVLDDIDWNVDGRLTNEKSIALLDKMFKRVQWVDEGQSQWGAWQK